MGASVRTSTSRVLRSSNHYVVNDLLRILLKLLGKLAGMHLRLECFRHTAAAMQTHSGPVPLGAAKRAARFEEKSGAA